MICPKYTRGKKSAAEVDFILSIQGNIIPLEVKSAATGQMRSLWQFLAEKNSEFAIKCDLKHRQQLWHDIEQKISIGTTYKIVKTKLFTLPLYAIEKIYDLTQEIG